MSEPRVLKWDVPVNDAPSAIGPGPVLAVACQHDERSVQVWTLEDGPAVPYPLTRYVQVFGTAQLLPPSHGQHLGTALVGPLVWHVFEVTR